MEGEEMTQSEFKTRTGYECGRDEYSAINAEYMNCTLDKDEFCRRWRVMYKERVKANRELQARLEAARSELFDAQREENSAVMRARYSASHALYEYIAGCRAEVSRRRDMVKALESELYNK